jgi:hypothetical protein
LLHSKLGRGFPKSASPTSKATLQSFDVPAYRKVEGHKILAWPAVQECLQVDLSGLPGWEGDAVDAERWLIKVTSDFGSLLTVDGNPNIYLIGSVLYPTIARSHGISKELVDSSCRIFFETLHCIYPIIDRNTFYMEVLPKAYETAFSENYEGSALVLIVIALGIVAHEGSTGAYILDKSSGRSTGVRGGTIKEPPGLVFVTETKRRIGLLLTEGSLVSLQCSILTAFV